jgi:hypothetical protein
MTDEFCNVIMFISSFLKISELASSITMSEVESEMAGQSLQVINMIKRRS